jgi:serine/threonine protein kinase
MDELKKCNSCGNTYPGNLSFCLDDGSPLVQADTLVGTILDGRYRLDSLIGTGGMGDVYRATHVHIDAEFAVKLLKPELVANQTALKRFRLEAKAAGRIHHPNAVVVTDFGVTPERIVYLVMELVKGQSLRSVMLKEGKLDCRRTVNLVRQVCGAVDAAHHSGVIHRDLKPDNILIETVQDTERVKVLDFGIAKLKEAKTDALLTQAGTIIGTPQYMSPEQCQGKHLDPSSDIYSIGIILYEMLTGEVPFKEEAALQVVYDQLHVPPRPLRELAPHVPVQLEQVVMRALEKNPGQRQASAIQLSDELKQALEMAREEGSLSRTDPLVTRPLGAAEALRAAEQSSQMPTLAEPRQHLFDKETTAMPGPSAETNILPTQVEAGQTISLGEKAAAAQKTTDPGQEIKAAAPGGNARARLMALAAIVLVALAAIIIYFSSKDEPAVPQQPTPQAPEGMVYIPGGKFLLGRNDGSPDEGPAHEVEVESFFLDLHEVTNQDYKRFIDATGHPAPKHWNFSGSYVPDEARLPVIYVTWDDATAYAKWANKRLPTEAEWEYAARGGDKGYRYPWGNQWQAGAANVDRKGQFKPAPVRSFDQDVSPFGIYDLAGNVSEWVQDFYTERYGAKPDQRLRVYRGGNFLDAPEKSMSTYRWADFPADIPEDQMLRVGFRCAKSVER